MCIGNYFSLKGIPLMGNRDAFEFENREADPLKINVLQVKIIFKIKSRKFNHRSCCKNPRAVVYGSFVSQLALCLLEVCFILKTLAKIRKHIRCIINETRKEK